MSVSALFEGSRAFSIMDQVEQLLSHTYGPRPDIDFACQVGVSAFCLRAFAMIDWNRSLCQRRETFFNFDFVPPQGMSTGYANDGSHDMVSRHDRKSFHGRGLLSSGLACHQALPSCSREYSISSRQCIRTRPFADHTERPSL